MQDLEEETFGQLHRVKQGQTAAEHRERKNLTFADHRGRNIDSFQLQRIEEGRV